MSRVNPEPESKLDQIMKMFHLTQADVKRVEKFFNILDDDRDGYIFVDALLSFAQIKRNLYTDCIFELLDISTAGGAISFCDFFISLVTYNFFETKDILRFCIHVYDDDGAGYITGEELVSLLRILHNLADADDKGDFSNLLVGFTGNVKTSLTKLHLLERPDQRLDIDSMVEIHRKYPKVLQPAYDLQVQLMKSFGGEMWWNGLKTRLINAQEIKKEKNDKEEEARKNKEEFVRNRRVIREMGILHYFLCPCFRKEFHKNKGKGGNKKKNKNYKSKQNKASGGNQGSGDENDNDDDEEDDGENKEEQEVIRKETNFQILSRMADLQAKNPETEAWETFQKKTDPEQGGSHQYIQKVFDKTDVMRDVRREARAERKQFRKIEHDQLRRHLTVVGRIK